VGGLKRYGNGLTNKNMNVEFEYIKVGDVILIEIPNSEAVQLWVCNNADCSRCYFKQDESQGDSWITECSEKHNCVNPHVNFIEQKKICPEISMFGATYPDATCIDGYLWDMDSYEEDAGGFTQGGEIPCPNCNKAEYDKYEFDLFDEEVSNQ
jgi:hypothetical protein